MNFHEKIVMTFQALQPPQRQQVLLRTRPASELRNLDQRLAKVLALQHADEPFGGTVDAARHVDGRLHAAVGDPLLHLLLVFGKVLAAKVRVHDDEAADGEALGDDLHQVADRVAVVGRDVVLAYHAAGD